jgi:2-dehydro-3-deoxyphosphogluconate aldolase / (4S)-4-hydroxy-2-oxoglutarate aldolase
MTHSFRTATREETVRIFGEDRLIAVVRAARQETAERAAYGMAKAGVRLVEITLTVPGALTLVEKLSADPEINSRSVIGAGTVLDGKQADDAVRAGARFLVSPVLVGEMIARAHAADVMSMPGTMTPTEMLQAGRLGADFIKIYPLATIGGPAYVAQVRRTLGHLPLVATGNISLDDIPRYLDSGVSGFGIADPLVRPDLAESEGASDAAARARSFLDATRSRP